MDSYEIYNEILDLAAPGHITGIGNKGEVRVRFEHCPWDAIRATSPAQRTTLKRSEPGAICQFMTHLVGSLPRGGPLTACIPLTTFGANATLISLCPPTACHLC